MLSTYEVHGFWGREISSSCYEMSGIKSGDFYRLMVNLGELLLNWILWLLQQIIFYIEMVKNELVAEQI